MEEILKQYQQSADLSLPLTMVNLAICIGMSLIIRYVYIKYSSTRSSKVALARVIPIVACSTFMIIVIVKSSLALSLGLVGALSIVRFRTPIKEPEELTFLFMAIAIGLGYGASQAKITTAIMSVTLVFIALLLGKYKHKMSGGSINCYIETNSLEILDSILEKAKSVFGQQVFIIRKTMDKNHGKLILHVISEDAVIKAFENELRYYEKEIKYEMLSAIQNEV